MATNLELVQNLYVAYFNRPGDQKGLEFYVDVLNRGAATIEQLSAGFNQSPEYTDLFAGKNNDQILGIVYQNLFGRAPDQQGLAFWSDKLDKKIVTVADVVKYVVAGAVNTDGTPNADAKVFANKTAAAIAFNDSLLQEGNAPARIAYGSGNTAILALVKNFLGKVTDDTSLAAAKAGMQAFTETIGSIDGATGQNGGANATLSALDSINGGAGSDILNINVLSGAGGGSAQVVALPAATLSNVEASNLRSAAGLAADVSSWTGVTDGNVKVTAVDDGIQVNGDRNVNVALTDVGGNDAATIVKLTGTVDLSNSSINDVGQGTLLFL